MTPDDVRMFARRAYEAVLDHTGDSKAALEAGITEAVLQEHWRRKEDLELQRDRYKAALEAQRELWQLAASIINCNDPHDIPFMHLHDPIGNIDKTLKDES